MTSPTLPVETDRLVLRFFEPEDLDEVMAYYALPDVQRYIDWPARDNDEVKEALEVMSGQVALNRPGDTLSLAILRREDPAVIGQVSLRWHDATAAQAEIRFAINPQHRRQGFATEAARAALDMGFGEFGFHRIFARCDARSQASARLLKGLGMRLEAHYREHALFQGEWDEELHFAILDREWARSPDIRDFGMHRVA
jgi:RimJ/RimL family protein N-acetyltransferase